MNLIANRQLTGDYGTVAPGQYFNADQDVAESLIARGLARSVFAGYETKVITPTTQEVKPLATPFRDLPRADTEPPALAALRTAVCSVPDIQPEGDPGGVERPASDGYDTPVSEAPAPSGKPDNRGYSKRRMRRRSR